MPRPRKYRTDDLPGMRCGKLTIVGEVQPLLQGPCRGRPGRRLARMVDVRCDCGAVETRRLSTVFSKKYDNHMCKSCARSLNALKHGVARENLALYNVWHSMVARTTDPRSRKYQYYGGRGITVHAAWLDVRVFADYVSHELGPKPSPAHSLDRINVNGNYEPGNLQWATKAQQIRNRRRVDSEYERGGRDRVNSLLADLDIALAPYRKDLEREPQRLEASRA
jgi:hypothetical protein